MTDSSKPEAPALYMPNGVNAVRGYIGWERATPANIEAAGFVPRPELDAAEDRVVELQQAWPHMVDNIKAKESELEAVKGQLAEVESDARRMVWFGSLVRSRTTEEQDELSALMRKYPFKRDQSPSPAVEPAHHGGAGGGDEDGHDMTGLNGGPTHRDVRNFLAAHGAKRFGATAWASLLRYIARNEQQEAESAKAAEGDVTCAFCHKNSVTNTVAAFVLIRGLHGELICEDCVDLAAECVAERRALRKAKPSPTREERRAEFEAFAAGVSAPEVSVLATRDDVEPVAVEPKFRVGQRVRRISNGKEFFAAASEVDDLNARPDAFEHADEPNPCPAESLHTTIVVDFSCPECGYRKLAPSPEVPVTREENGRLATGWTPPTNKPSQNGDRGPQWVSDTVNEVRHKLHDAGQTNDYHLILDAVSLLADALEATEGVP